jgi:hypothetical protein
MADNFGFQEGNDRDARARELGEGLVIPMTEAASAIPTVLACVNQSVTTAAALSEIPEGATHALVAVDPGADIRFRDDGEDPTTTVGLYVLEGGAVELTNLADIRVVSAEGTAKINISYRKYDE